MKRGFSAWFIDRPVATTLITAAFVLIGLRCFPMLPVAPLPQTDIPTIRVIADFPGADAETMASAVIEGRQGSEMGTAAKDTEEDAAEAEAEETEAIAEEEVQAAE